MRATVLALLAAITCALAGDAYGALYAVRYVGAAPLDEAAVLGATVRLIGVSEAVVEADTAFEERASDRGLLIRRLDAAGSGERLVVWYPGSSADPVAGRVLWSDSVHTAVVAASPAEVERLRDAAHQITDLPESIDVAAWFDDRPPAHVERRGSLDEDAWRGVVSDVLENVSSDSLMAIVRRLSQTPSGDRKTRFVFHDECLSEAKPMIVAALERALPPGSPIELQRFTIPGYTCEGGVGGPSLDYPADNIIGTLRGNGRLGGSYVICGHYDSIASSSAFDDSLYAFWWCQHKAPGADDNATGAATVLEAARVLSTSGLEFPFDIRFILFSGEELNLKGSDAYVDSIHAAGDTIYAALTVDMTGYKRQAGNPDTCHLVTNRGTQWLADWMVETAELYPSAFPSYTVARIDTPLAYSDHGSFWVRGYDGLVAVEHWAPRERNPYYHTIDDRIDKVYASQLASTARLVAGAVARLGDPEGSFNLAVFSGDIRMSPTRPWTGSSAVVRVNVHAFGPDTLASFDIEVWDGEPDEDELLATFPVNRTVGSGEVIFQSFAWPLDESDIGDHDLTVRVVADDMIELSTSDNVARHIVNVRSNAAIAVVDHGPAVNPATSMDDVAICYELSREAQLLELEVFDITGQKVASYSLHEGDPGLDAGGNELPWSTISEKNLASGVYIYRLRVVARDVRGSTTSDVVTGKFALVR